MNTSFFAPSSIGPTRHFEDRAFERGLSPEVESFILTWGEEIEAHGAASYVTVVRRELPGEVRWSRTAKRAEGWVLVVSAAGSVITCYRLRNAWKTLRRRRDVKFLSPKAGEKPIQGKQGR
jgi:hypothetical protein